jgi:DNA-binding SARP family transcriptional activator
MLFLKTLGGLSVELEGAPGSGAGQQRKTLALLALLAAAGRRGFSRDKLTAFLWPESDTEHARSLLKQACYALRRDLHAPELFLGAVELRLNPAVITSDIQTFEHAVEGGDPERAAVVYAGPFLDGFYLGAAGEFERWMEDERSRLARQALEAVESLANKASSVGDVKTAMKWWRRLTELDPLSAQAALGLMRALGGVGERAEAVQHGRRYEAYVRQELGVDPAAEVLAMIQDLHHQTGEGVRRAPECAVVVEPPSVEPALGPLRSGRLGWRPALAAAAIVLVGGMVAVARSRKPAALDPELLAVAPFDVFDPTLELWHEGLVDVLSRKLDGAGALRTVSPTVVIRRWRGLADRASAEGLGRRTGAGVVVFGQLLSAGPDSVRLSATVLDAWKGRTLAEIDRIDQADRIDRLADSLSIDVIRALTSSAPGVHIRLFSVGTRSLPALKAFLQGERLFRRLALDSAIASYDRAIALDTTFALALRRAGLARGWNLQLGEPYFARAGVFNHGLGPRDSLLVAGDSVDVPGLTPRRWLVRRKVAILEEAARRYPEDPEVWYQLGEVQFHAGDVGGYTWSDARAAFDRTIALDSSFAPAYIHPVEIALNDNDPGAARRYVRGYLTISSVIPEGAGMRLLNELLDPQRVRPWDFERELETISPSVLYHLAFAVRSWPDAEQRQIQVAHRIIAVAQAHPLGAGADAALERRLYQALLANVLVHRGHLREARAVVGNSVEMSSFIELALIGAIPPETVETVLARWVQHPGEPDLLYFPWFATGPCYRTLDAALWWASRRDTATLQRLVRREDSAARTVNRLVPLYARPVPELARAALALTRGDTTAALSRFLAFPDSLCPGAERLREVRFRLLTAVGRGTEAAEVFDRSHDRRVPLMLARARLAERLGDRDTAIHYYQFVLQAWQHADPELQPVVAEARAALSRLGEKRGP